MSCVIQRLVRRIIAFQGMLFLFLLSYYLAFWGVEVMLIAHFPASTFPLKFSPFPFHSATFPSKHHSEPRVGVLALNQMYGPLAFAPSQTSCNHHYPSTEYKWISLSPTTQPNIHTKLQSNCNQTASKLELFSSSDRWYWTSLMAGRPMKILQASNHILQHFSTILWISSLVPGNGSAGMRGDSGAHE